MGVITFSSRLKDDGIVVVPVEAVETLEIHSGDEIQVRIEGANGTAELAWLDQAELQRRAALLFHQADSLAREPGMPLSDPPEAAWAEGVAEKARRAGLKL